MRTSSSWILTYCLSLALTFGGCGSADMGSNKMDPGGLGAEQGATENIIIDNQITASSAPACIFADPQKLVSLFNPDQQTIGPGRNGPYPISGGQFGLQINFWYWAQNPFMSHAIGTWSCTQGQCNNPDNSGAQFILASDCSIASMSPPVFGVGKETYVIADISAGMQGGECVLTIKPNQYTACVTPGCCDYAAAGQCTEGTQGTYAAGCTTPPP